MNDFAQGPATVRLGDLEVRRLGFGAMQLPGPMVWGEPKDAAGARAVLRRAVELGVQLIDTSWYYGPLVSNRLIAEALHPYPTDLVLATKLGGRRTEDKGWASALRPEELRTGCETDLRTLKLDRIDVVHLRWIHGSEVPFREALDAMIDLRSQGKVRHIGLSNVTRAQLDLALGLTPVVSVQNLYNAFAGEKRLGALPHAVIAEQEAIVDGCAEHGIAFLPFFLLAVPGKRRESSAVLSRIAEKHGVTEAQVGLAWLLARSRTMLPIPGTSSVAHLEQNWDARKVSLTAGEVAELSVART
jgi:aryl-alcohol dehydrogenase-like predicted oxidoreductase